MSNYTQEVEGKGQEAKATIFEDFISRARIQLNTQAELAKNIQSKLHLISDRQIPEKGSSGEDVSPNGNDFTGHLSNILSTIEGNNFLLEKIYKHLSELI